MARTKRQQRLGYGNINNEDDADHVTIRSGRKRRRRRCICFALLLGSILFLLLAAVGGLSAIILLDLQQDDANTCSSLPSIRINCIPEVGSLNTEEVCQDRSCCWKTENGSPSCFYPSDFGYKVEGKVENTTSGLTVNASRNPDQKSQYGSDIDTIRVDFFYETAYRLRVKVSHHHLYFVSSMAVKRK